MREVRARGRQLKPHMETVLEQTGEWLRRHAELLKGHRWFERAGSSPRRAVYPSADQLRGSKLCSQPGLRERTRDARRHPQVPVGLWSHFAQKGRTVSAEGELRDLSPWGCRVRSAVAVSIGADLEYRIFPHDASNPFIIDGVTVRWISSQEFGLAITTVRPGVQR